MKKLPEKLVFSCLVIFLATNVAKAQDKNQDITKTYQSANQNYKSDNYLKAEEEYKSILKSGLINGDVFYNLGNTYFKLGQTGLALTNYKKAENFIPREQKLKKNINSLYEKINYQETTLEQISSFFKLINFKENLVLFSVLWLLIFLIILLKKTYYNKSGKAYNNLNKIALLIIPFFLYSVLTMSLKIVEYYQNEAIIIVEESEVKVSNNFSAVTLFKVKENQKVNIISESGDWAKISFENNKGWINISSLGKIN